MFHIDASDMWIFVTNVQEKTAKYIWFVKFLNSPIIVKIYTVYKFNWAKYRYLRHSINERQFLPETWETLPQLDHSSLT